MATSQELKAWLEDAKLCLTWNDVRVRQDANSVSWAKNRGVSAFIDGRTKIAGEDVVLRLGLTSEFPDRLPFVQLVSPRLGRFLAHVEIDQNVCYTNSSEMVIDPQRLVDVICWIAEQAVNTLEKSLTTSDNSELLDEFTAYWRQYIFRQIERAQS